MTSAGSTLPPLSVQYDDLISCTNVLLPGTEGGEKLTKAKKAPHESLVSVQKHVL